MPNPLVTVVIPTYNCARTLKLALVSVLAQDFADFEIQVVGDGCTDDSEATVRALNDPRVSWTNLPANSGTPSAPRNEGQRRGRGTFLAYLGHDDLWFPWHLSSLVAAMGQGQDFAYSLGINYSRTTETEGPRFAFTLPAANAVKTAMLSPSNWMMTRAFAQRVGPWNTQLASAVDKEFLLRAWETGMQTGRTERLSAIKFPSWEWEPYRASAACPQAPLLQAMQDDPLALEHRLLTQLATHVAGQPYQVRPAEDSRSEFSWSMLYLRAALMTAYGRQRWPLKQLIEWLETRNARQARGLESAPQHPGPHHATGTRDPADVR